MTGFQRTKITIFLVTVMIFSAIFFSGCARKPKLDGLVPVRGTLTFQEEPLDGAIVTFSPKIHKQGNRAAVATTDQKGRFELRTLGEKGVMPNEYRVSIVKNTAENMEKPTPGKAPRRPTKTTSLIPRRYNDEKTSGIEFSIDEKGSDDLRIQLEKR